MADDTVQRQGMQHPPAYVFSTMEHFAFAIAMPVAVVIGQQLLAYHS